MFSFTQGMISISLRDAIHFVRLIGHRPIVGGWVNYRADKRIKVVMDCVPKSQNFNIGGWKVAN